MNVKELENLISEGERVLRTSSPNERQRNWRDWTNRLRTTLERFPNSSDLRLELTAQSLPEDLKKINDFCLEVGDAPKLISEATKDENVDKIHVFLSYLSEDESVAKIVKEELLAFNERIQIFKADDSLRAGRRWRTELTEELKRASWFILVYTDPEKDWQWPIFESVTFEAMHGGSPRGDRRLCCLHGTKKHPKPLAEFQNYYARCYSSYPTDNEETAKLKARHFYENSPLYRFLRSFLSYPESNPIHRNPSQINSHIIESARSISEAFLRAQEDTVVDETYYSARLEIGLKKTKSKEPPKMTDDATVVLGPVAQQLFRIADKSLSWKKFGERYLRTVIEDDSAIWIDQLEDAINQATDGQLPDPTMAVLYSRFTGRFYKPVLSRQQHLLSGLRRFYVTLIEQLPVDFSSHRQPGLVLAALIVGARFRFEFIEKRSQQLKLIDSPDDLAKLCVKMKMQLGAIEAEGAQHGLLDESPLLSAFPTDDQDTVHEWYDRWSQIREDLTKWLADGIDKRKEVEEIKIALSKLLSDQLADLNSSFMVKAAERYVELVKMIFMQPRTIAQPKKKATRRGARANK